MCKKKITYFTTLHPLNIQNASACSNCQTVAQEGDGIYTQLRFSSRKQDSIVSLAQIPIMYRIYCTVWASHSWTNKLQQKPSWGWQCVHTMSTHCKLTALIIVALFCRMFLRAVGWRRHTWDEWHSAAAQGNIWSFCLSLVCLNTVMAATEQQSAV